GARLGHLPTTRAGLQAAPAVGHVDRRLVVAVVVPGGRRPGVGADEARPHPAGRDGLFPVHTRRRMTRDPFAWRDVAGRFSGAHASPWGRRPCRCRSWGYPPWPCRPGPGRWERCPGAATGHPRPIGRTTPTGRTTTGQRGRTGRP